MKIYNSLGKKKQIFKTIKKNTVKIYVCGITAYDHCHIGHARSFLAFDMIVRFLRFKKYKVVFVRNITDIDDKIINKSIKNNISIKEVTDKYIVSMQQDIESLNLIPPSFEPRATQYIEKMILFIEKLIKKEFAYKSKNGDIYFSIDKFKRYGELSCNNMDNLQQFRENKEKNNIKDFTLWKMSKPNEPKWNSPWGQGRPGWHLECSVMSMEKLGVNFDIHGGGRDLLFPHHENEKAQSEALTNQTFSNYWMHVGCLNINKNKMSKSLKNDISIKSLLNDYHQETIRLFFFSCHYRKSMDFSYKNMQLCEDKIVKMYLSVVNVKYEDIELTDHSNCSFRLRFLNAMEDDFNTPLALAVIYDLHNQLENFKNKTQRKEIAIMAKKLVTLSNILGIMSEIPLHFLQNRKKVDRKFIKKQIALRSFEKKKKNWKAADKIRDDLFKMNIQIQDLENKTFWYIL